MIDCLEHNIKYVWNTTSTLIIQNTTQTHMNSVQNTTRTHCSVMGPIMKMNTEMNLVNVMWHTNCLDTIHFFCMGNHCFELSATPQSHNESPGFYVETSIQNQYNILSSIQHKPPYNANYKVCRKSLFQFWNWNGLVFNISSETEYLNCHGQ